jgi:hypothetical protein
VSVIRRVRVSLRERAMRCVLRIGLISIRRMAVTIVWPRIIPTCMGPVTVVRVLVWLRLWVLRGPSRGRGRPERSRRPIVRMGCWEQFALLSMRLEQDIADVICGNVNRICHAYDAKHPLGAVRHDAFARDEPCTTRVLDFFDLAPRFADDTPHARVGY